MWELVGPHLENQGYEILAEAEPERSETGLESSEACQWLLPVSFY